MPKVLPKQSDGEVSKSEKIVYSVVFIIFCTFLIF